jgi:uncharacterized HAD superfamily protein/adenine/guanine phosphoribosyltransferase-like PRPP-binding protein
MKYRSVSDMNSDILKNIHRLPPDLDLIVGIPRSGLLAANLLALLGNVRLTDFDSYLERRVYSSGITKADGMRTVRSGPQKVLVIDDSINTGQAMTDVRRRFAAAGLQDTVIFGAVYGTKPDHSEVDIVFEIVSQPRIFQWNFMHHTTLLQSCVEIDGVLCHHPSEEENDDGAAYVTFLTEARPLYNMTHPIGTLVTSRLEKYRPQTEAWLERIGVHYEKLVMLDLPSKAEKQRLSSQVSFKADYYRKSDAVLFIESENREAQTIARRSGKPVMCLESQTLIEPSMGAILLSVAKAGPTVQGLRTVKQGARSVLGSHRYEALKKRLWLS